MKLHVLAAATIAFSLFCGVTIATANEADTSTKDGCEAAGGTWVWTNEELGQGHCTNLPPKVE